ncbi:glycoprotein 3-alpha-L-fucosyltransferase A-like [Actinia tenebrosa]|uniref:Fucosyltransferase n=1 Tax=Actinia tenebrosa TaxID=6105 RepID=A0A6P8HBX0_ACTTE|nr:glycoprotein 3-alpha-L-fucosyltransferase A-like [Actinia tenebrosa]
MNTLKKLFLIFTIIVGLVCLLLLIMTFQNSSQPSIKSYKVTTYFPVKSDTKPKRVLMYTTWFGISPWPGVKANSYFSDGNGNLCPVSNCVFTYDKEELENSDAVIFHARDIPSIETMRTISLNKNRLKQRWIYYSHESPYYILHDPTAYNYFFNWTMTYRYKSDIFMPYRYYRKITPEERMKVIQGVNYAQAKDKLIAWSVSNCGRIRDKIVNKLLKYVKISISGKCSKKFNQNYKCKRSSRQCEVDYKKSKFYLAFENSMCLDYVTEKYWSAPFINNMVPIVLGSNYDEKVAIPGSFINALDFPSIKALASYIQFLDKNDTAYNEYFKWKSKYTFDESFSSDCQLCAMLHNDSLPVKIYKNLDIFWGRSTCNQRAEDIKRLLKD